jgi:hypothetical protein
MVNRYPGICRACGDTVPIGVGKLVMRQWDFSNFMLYHKLCHLEVEIRKMVNGNKGVSDE